MSIIPDALPTPTPLNYQGGAAGAQDLYRDMTALASAGNEAAAQALYNQAKHQYGFTDEQFSPFAVNPNTGTSFSASHIANWANSPSQTNTRGALDILENDNPGVSAPSAPAASSDLATKYRTLYETMKLLNNSGNEAAAKQLYNRAQQTYGFSDADFSPYAYNPNGGYFSPEHIAQWKGATGTQTRPNDLSTTVNVPANTSSTNTPIGNPLGNTGTSLGGGATSGSVIAPSTRTMNSNATNMWLANAMYGQNPNATQRPDQGALNYWASRIGSQGYDAALPEFSNAIQTSQAAPRPVTGALSTAIPSNASLAWSQPIQYRNPGVTPTTQDQSLNPQGGQVQAFARGGQVQGALSRVAASRYVRGGAGGQDDTVHAKLSPGEYVMDAEAVSALGDGNNEAGAKKLDQMRQNIRKHKRGGALDKIPPKAKAPEQYLKGTK